MFEEVCTYCSTDKIANPLTSVQLLDYQAYWQGHSERCNHYAGKMHQLTRDTGKINNMIITFYQGLNTFQVLKRQNTAKLRVIPKNAIATLKAANFHSRWNFRNKVS